MLKNQTQIVKKLIGLCGLLVLAHGAQAQFTFPVYEPFSEYTAGEEFGGATSSVNWSSGSTASGSSPVIAAVAALSYPGLVPDPGATPLGLHSMTTATSAKYRHAPFTSQSSGTVYCSFLLNVTNISSVTVNTIILSLSSSTSSSTATGVSAWLNPAGELQLGKNTSTTSGGPSILYTSAATNTPVLTSSNTYLVVMAYKFNTNSSTDDEVELWLDPTSLGNDSNVPSPLLTVTNGADVTSLQSLFFYQAVAPPGFYIDEMRVASDWAGVTPASPSPGTTFNVTGGGAGCPGDAFEVGLSGSVATDAYWLYVNSAYSGVTLAGTGSALSFGPQSISGIYTVLASNTVNGNVGWMNSNVVVSVLSSPDITTEPSSAVVATNSIATFTVVASGTGLNYQWYKNGAGLNNGGHIAGAQTSSLTVSPATTADQATALTGYYVIITNSCGFSSTSVTNALTLDAAANLTWQGGNPNTNWDLSTTPNWTNSSGTAVVFNSGDNVTFDDTSTNPVVTELGFLAPTSVIENAYQNYYFLGGGNIAGSATLLMEGYGTLTFSNANTFTGGTTISNGILAVEDPNQMALGFGLVNLAGGTLWFPLKSGTTTVGLTNNINVTANSTLQFDGAGTEAQDLFGSLGGSPGTTLTINHNLNNSASPDRLRLYGAFTNNLPIVVNTAGDTVEFAPYNPAGSQVYNGVISGSGGRLAPHGAGGVIFNGANTINDNNTQNNGNGPVGYSLLFGGGGLGIGIDSVVDHSTVPPTIDSSAVGTGNVGIDTTAGNDTIFASGGSHTVANPFIYTSATNSVSLTVSGSNNLTFSGTFNLSGADGSGGTNRTIVVNNTALTTISGVVSDASLVCGLIKSGAGTLVLSAVNTYTGPTLLGGGPLWVNGQINSGGVTVTNGSLGGNGSILSAVTVNSPGSIAPGTSAIGTLAISSSLTLAGNAVFKLNKSLAQSNDIVSVSGALANTGTGTLTVTNLGPAIAVGDKFTLFSEPMTTGNTLTVTGGGMNWTNRLAIDGSIQALSVASTTANYPTNITYSVSSGILTIGWPATHLGWILQSQTNSLSAGLTTSSNTWFDMTGTATGTNASMTINPTNPTVFFRIRHP